MAFCSNLYVMENIYTSQQVGEMLNLKIRSVEMYAHRYGVGRKFGRDWAFTAADIEVIKEHKSRGRGRPPLDKDKKGKS